ncbi:MAG: iron ABC transporter permease [Victivallaceae bacterium]|nr:iron ABC transporter permease [Victivallaceae bacterium]
MKKTFLLTILLILVAAAFWFGLRCGAVDAALDSPVVTRIRLPRLVLGMLVGAALAVSGTVLQAVLRNDLAAPEIIGVSSGGALAAVAAVVAFPALSALAVPLAFAGALAAALLVCVAAWRHGNDPLRLVLAGVAVSALASSGAGGILICNADKVSGILNFLSGSLASASWGRVEMVWPYIVVGLCAALLSARRLDMLRLGDEVAMSLGVRVELTRFFLIAVAALLASAAVAAAGLVGFVGLVAPHLARLILGGGHRTLLSGAALSGALLVIFCDTLGRWLLAPRELPCGILMALVGAPFFLYLLRRGGGIYED